jgi:hypothetical protein
LFQTSLEESLSISDDDDDIFVKQQTNKQLLSSENTKKQLSAVKLQQQNANGSTLYSMLRNRRACFWFFVQLYTW